MTEIFCTALLHYGDQDLIPTRSTVKLMVGREWERETGEGSIIIIGVAKAIL